MNLALLILCSILYLWITAAFEAFSSLTGGRILKVAERDRKFAEQLENWHDREESLRALLKLILCVLAAFAGVPDESRTMPVGAQAIGVNLDDADHNEANNPGWLELKEVAVYTSADAAEPRRRHSSN